MDRCLAMFKGPGIARTTFINNKVSFCGQEGIRLVGDTGTFKVESNTITDIQTAPVFEKCGGVGTGCLSGFSDNGTAIRIVNPNGAGGLIANNTILRVGGGQDGNGRGINLENASANNIIENNYIAHIVVSPFIGYGILLSGSFAGDLHHNNIIRNNRLYNVDACYAQKYGGNFTSQAGARNYFVNNTCANPVEFGMISEGSAVHDGNLNIQNNLFMADTQAPVFLSVRSTGTPGWDNFTFNGLECTSCPTGHAIINYRGRTVLRDGDCTPMNNCLADLMTPPIHSNVYGTTMVDTVGSEPKLDITSGSIGLDAGKTIAEVKQDYLGTPRPNGAGYDIGAFEVTDTPPSFVMTQKSFQFYGQFLAAGGEPLMALNQNIMGYSHSFFSLRFAITATAGNAPTKQLKLFARRCNSTCGSWSAVTENNNAPEGLYILNNPDRSNRHILANRLPLDGLTFNTEGVYIDDDEDPTVFTLNRNTQGEIEYSLGVTSAASLGDTIEVRMKESDGSDLDVYMVTPSITIVERIGQFEGGATSH
ncbi:MAG: hypothetical protein ETSY1_27430 [Candidatus Entotheonella factor]|uniref:Right handed beta helix domain-containing protein n=1 Tax=Entotheonella factor TaxID=1429438 RepID=W4LE25_ENTF1|nr:MAG: hypothetical protein ETSY1_27430 [Candidatus Entotheonella factor]